MAQVDSSIPLGVKPIELDNPVNAMARVLQMQNLQQDQQLNGLKLQAGQRDLERTNKLYDLMGSGADAAALRKAGYLKEANDWEKNQVDNDKNRAEGLKNNVEAENKTIGMYRDASQAITDPVSAAEFVKHMHTDPRLANSAIARVPLEQVLSQIPQDPAQLAAWKQQFALGATKFMELNKPTTNVVNTGSQTQMVQTPGLGGAPTVAGTFTNSQSPDNAATNATHVQTTGMTNATSRANNRDTIAAENVRAGVMPGGGMDENSERTAQAIANGQLPAPTGMALLNPKNQRILGRVMEINPNYDATTVSAKKTAAAAFTSGPLGNALRSVSTANAHLDQLNELVDAMGNGNTQVVNKVQNYFSKQTGSPNVTNFEAIKAIVGQEVVKAIVSGGGGVGEREEAAKIFSSASSPAQLKGAIQHYRMVMGAQANNLMEQRRAAGLPDTTLPNYSNTNNSAPQGMPAASAIDAELARRAGKK